MPRNLFYPRATKQEIATSGDTTIFATSRTRAQETTTTRYTHAAKTLRNSTPPLPPPATRNRHTPPLPTSLLPSAARNQPTILHVGDRLSIHEEAGHAERALERPSAVAPQVEDELVRPLGLHLHEGVLEGVRHDGVEVSEAGVAHLVLALVLAGRERERTGFAKSQPTATGQTNGPTDGVARKGALFYILLSGDGTRARKSMLVPGSSGWPIRVSPLRRNATVRSCPRPRHTDFHV